MAPLRAALFCALTALAIGARAEPGPGDPRAAGAPIDRPQDRRRTDPLAVPVLGRMLEIRGELETSVRYDTNPWLESGGGESFLRLGPELRVDFTYPLGERAFLYAELFGYLDAAHASDDPGVAFDGALELSQAFLHLDDLLGGDVGVRLGRQAVFEERGWWWDADLDAVRLLHERGPLRAALAVAWQLARVSTDGGRDPEEDEVLRVLGHVEWDLGDDWGLEAFLLLQNDRSRRESVGHRVRAGREDPSDADLRWLGVRASGEHALGRWGELEVLLEAVWMGGRELAFAVDDATSRVTSRGSRSVEGFSLTASLSWELPLPLDPTLTVEYAFGSGDADLDDDADRSFRQTGLQSNEGRFDGVAYFDLYGALLRPELSNLHILTLAVGVPILRASSVDLVLHVYRQARAAPTLRARGIEALPDGIHPDLGHALDLVVGLREWRRVEVDLVASAFRADAAFGDRAGRLAFGLALEVELEF